MGVIQTKIKLAKSKNKTKPIRERKTSEESSSLMSSFTSSISSKGSVKFPSSDSDIDFLHQHHFIVKSIWSSNYSSPIDNVLSNGDGKILDALCYAGTFVLELSNEYQSTEFFGIDRNKLFPSEIKPNNVKFFNADLLDGIPWEDNYFDFAHLNIIEPVFLIENWEFIIKELLR
jgi:hypothetical protein